MPGPRSADHTGVTDAPPAETPAPPDLGFTVTLDAFTGPLDLLLYLVRKADVDITDIPIALIADQFATIVAATERVDLEQAGDFIVWAATLLEIKARAVVPPDEPTARSHDPEEILDPRADLVRRLLEYRTFKEASFLLVECEQQWRGRHERRLRELIPDDGAAAEALDLGEIDTWTLCRTWEDILQRINGMAPRTVVVDDMPMERRLQLVLESIRARGEGTLDELFAVETSRLVRTSIVLALLEGARQRFIEVRQDEQFGTIRFRLRADEERAQPDGARPDPEPLPRLRKALPLVTYTSVAGGGGDDEDDDGPVIESEDQRFARELEDQTGVDSLLRLAADVDGAYVAWIEQEKPHLLEKVRPPPPPEPVVVPAPPAPVGDAAPVQPEPGSAFVAAESTAPPASATGGPESAALVLPAPIADAVSPIAPVPSSTEPAPVASVPTIEAVATAEPAPAVLSDSPETAEGVVVEVAPESVGIPGIPPVSGDHAAVSDAASALSVAPEPLDASRVPEPLDPESAPVASVPTQDAGAEHRETRDLPGDPSSGSGEDPAAATSECAAIPPAVVSDADPMMGAALSVIVPMVDAVQPMDTGGEPVVAESVVDSAASSLLIEAEAANIPGDQPPTGPVAAGAAPWPADASALTEPVADIVATVISEDPPAVGDTEAMPRMIVGDAAVPTEADSAPPVPLRDAMEPMAAVSDPREPEPAVDAAGSVPVADGEPGSAPSDPEPTGRVFSEDDPTITDAVEHPEPMAPLSDPVVEEVRGMPPGDPAPPQDNATDLVPPVPVAPASTPAEPVPTTVEGDAPVAAAQPPPADVEPPVAVEPAPAVVADPAPSPTESSVPDTSASAVGAVPEPECLVPVADLEPTDFAPVTIAVGLHAMPGPPPVTEPAPEAAAGDPVPEPPHDPAGEPEPHDAVPGTGSLVARRSPSCESPDDMLRLRHLKPLAAWLVLGNAVAWGAYAAWAHRPAEVLSFTTPVVLVGDEPLTVTFNLPMWATKPDAAPAVTFDQPVDGAWSWQSATQARFVPSRPWPLDSAIRIRGDGLATADGFRTAVGDDRSVGVMIPLPGSVRLLATGTMADWELRFPVAVDPVTVVQSLRIDGSRAVQLASPDPAVVRVRAPVSGPVARFELRAPFAWSAEIPAMARQGAASASARSAVDGGAILVATDLPADAALAAGIRTEPPVAAAARVVPGGVELRGPFRPGTAYTVQVPGRAVAEDPAAGVRPGTLAVQVPAPAPAVAVTVAGPGRLHLRTPGAERVRLRWRDTRVPPWLQTFPRRFDVAVVDGAADLDLAVVDLPEGEVDTVIEALRDGRVVASTPLRLSTRLLGAARLTVPVPVPEPRPR